MSKQPLTDRQREVLDFIKSYIKEEGFPPTRAEIADHFGFKSHNASNDFVKILKEKGFISVKADANRGIKVL